MGLLKKQRQAKFFTLLSLCFLVVSTLGELIAVSTIEWWSAGFVGSLVFGFATAWWRNKKKIQIFYSLPWWVLSRTEELFNYVEEYNRAVKIELRFKAAAAQLVPVDDEYFPKYIQEVISTVEGRKRKLESLLAFVADLSGISDQALEQIEKTLPIPDPHHGTGIREVFETAMTEYLLQKEECRKLLEAGKK